MKKIIFVFSLILLASYSSLSQTQLLKVGNAVQYFHDPGLEDLRLTIDKEIINGKEYFKIKNNYSPWVNPDYFQISYERIQGDSVHYVLSSTNSDSLVFNFNWLPGTIVKSYTESNWLCLEILDSIKIKSTFSFIDTVYYLGERWIDLNTGDTASVLPATVELSKKFGRLILGMWTAMNGVKVDGIRYTSFGSFFPFPEEITFSADSLYSEFIGDTVNCFIRNTSDYDVVLDSILTSSMYGYLMYLIKDNDYFFINLFIQYPNHPLDTLKYTIPAHDSIQLQIYDIDLCPICKELPQDYFEDTLRFVFTFHEEYVYSFSNYIGISGEGRPSGVEEDKILPNEVILYQNYPNPFNPSTSIQYVLGSRQFVQLKVYDVLGNEVAMLVNEEKFTGTYQVNFDASTLSSGVYFYQLKTGSNIQTKKMILLR